METQINEQNFFETINKLNYGINTVTFENDVVADMTAKAIDVINMIFKLEIISLKPDETEHEKGVFNIVWKSRTESPPMLTLDDISIEENASVAANFEKQTMLTLTNEVLLKHAKKMANKYKVKFIGGDVQCFDGRTKTKSVARRMEESINAGEDSVSFTSDEATIQTVRVYASNLAALKGRKIRVTADNDRIKVIFKESSGAQVVKARVENLWQECVREIGIEATADIFRDVVALHTSGTAAQPEDDFQVSSTTQPMMTDSDAFEEAASQQHDPTDDDGPAKTEEVVEMVLGPDRQFYIPGTLPVVQPDEEDDGF